MTYPRSLAGFVLAAVLGASLAACDPSTPTTAGQRADAAAVRAPEHRVARSIAQAMDDEAVRGAVLDAMRQSRVKERKLHLQSYLSGPSGALLLNAAAERFGASPDAFLRTVRALPELELYLPVAEDRRTWTGTQDVYVAAALEDPAADGTVLAFDTQGRARRVDGTRHAGAVLVLVPVETDFSRAVLPPAMHPGRTVDPADEGLRAPLGEPLLNTSTVPGTYLVRYYLLKSFEPWTRGSHEIDVFAWGEGSSTQNCFRQTGVNDGSWITVDPDLMLTMATPNPAGGYPAVVTQWYEDDDGACVRSSSDDYIGLLYTYQSDLYPGVAYQTIGGSNARASLQVRP